MWSTDKRRLIYTFTDVHNGKIKFIVAKDKGDFSNSERGYWICGYAIIYILEVSLRVYSYEHGVIKGVPFPILYAQKNFFE